MGWNTGVLKKRQLRLHGHGGYMLVLPTIVFICSQVLRFNTILLFTKTLYKCCLPIFRNYPILDSLTL